MFYRNNKIKKKKKWWYSIDKIDLFLIILLLFLSNIFAFIASPIVANRIGANKNIFIIKI